MTPSLASLPVQSQYNYTLAGIARQNSIYVPISMHEKHIYDVEKQMGRSTKPVLPTTVIEPEKESRRSKKRSKKIVQKGGFKETNHPTQKSELCSTSIKQKQKKKENSRES